MGNYQLIGKVRKVNRLNLEFLSEHHYDPYFRMNGGALVRDCCLYLAGADPFMLGARPREDG
jgi:hypothetical protein